MISANYNNNIPRSYDSSERNFNTNNCGVLRMKSAPDKDCVSFGAGNYARVGNIIEYVKEDSTEEDVITALKDSQNSKRSFFGYKKKIAGTFLSAKDKKTAALNLNVLLNKDGQTLNARKISEAFSVLVDAANYNPADDVAKYLRK